MKQIIVSMYDSVAEVFARPIFVANEAVAVRSLRDEVNNPQSEIALHYRDYALYRVGEFDDSVGTILAESIPTLICRADSLKEVV